MRSYARNSPQAAARLVALVLLADSHACRSEFAELERLDATAQLGLKPGEFPRIVQTLCEDLMQSGHQGLEVDEATLLELMAEVDDVDLQRKVLALGHAAASADTHLAHAEEVILQVARRYWPLAARGTA